MVLEGDRKASSHLRSFTRTVGLNLTGRNSIRHLMKNYHGGLLSDAFNLIEAERSKEMATMIVTSKNNRGSALGRFYRFLGFGKPASPRLVFWEQTPALNQALQTIRMAANPGEGYEIVAARIEAQAAAYLEFLNNPQPI